MIIFLYGKDTYRARRKIKEIIEHYKKIHKSGLNLKLFNCLENKDLKFDDLKDEVRQATMFKEKKLVVVLNPFSNADFKEKLLEEGEVLEKSDDIILLYQEGAVRESESLLKFLKKKAKCQKFELLSTLKLRKWVKEELENYKVKIENQTIDKIIEYVGDDLWRMENEIKKLVNYKNKGKIETKDIELLVKPRIETDIFKTIDVIAQKNKGLALKLLQKHLEKGDNPLYLLSMINYQFRNLLIIKDLIEKNRSYNLIIKKSGLHPFVVRKTYSQSRWFTIQELKKIYQRIFEVDLDIKTGKIEPEAALELLVAET